MTRATNEPDAEQDHCETGTAQRRKLVRKDGVAPHLLSMTATPIPRTLALTIYGDLDLSLLDEMPAGRKQIITEIIPPDKPLAR